MFECFFEIHIIIELNCIQIKKYSILLSFLFFFCLLATKILNSILYEFYSSTCFLIPFTVYLLKKKYINYFSKTKLKGKGVKIFFINWTDIANLQWIIYVNMTKKNQNSKSTRYGDIFLITVFEDLRSLDGLKAWIISSKPNSLFHDF